MLLRLCGVIQNIKYGFKAASLIKTCDSEIISEEFILGVEQVLEQARKECSIIDVETLNHAYNLLSYFNIHKLIIAGYDIDVDVPEFNLEEAVKQLIEDNADDTTLASKASFQKVLILPGPELISTTIQERFRWSKEDTKNIFAGLVSLKLGQISNSNGKNGRAILVFKKRTLTEIQADLEAANNFIALDIDSNTYSKTFDMDVIQTKSVQRNRKTIFTHRQKSLESIDESSIGIASLTTDCDLESVSSIGIIEPTVDSILDKPQEQVFKEPNTAEVAYNGACSTSVGSSVDDTLDTPILPTGEFFIY